MTKRIAAVLVLALSLAACTADQITSTLEAAVDAAIAADSIARPQDAPLLAVVTGCLDKATSVLASTATPPIKATEIAAGCATALAASKSNTALIAVTAALDAFLKAVGVTASQIQFSNPQMVSAFASSPAGKVSARKLKAIRKKVEKLKTRHPAK